MTESPTFQRLGTEALEEHRQIHFYLDRLEETLSGLDPDSGDVEPLRRLAAQIDSLRERFDEHVHLEEGGLYHAVVEALPEAAAEVRRLKNEHARMVETLEMARIRARRGDASEIPLLRADLEHFIRMMRTHERSEDALVQRAIREGSTD